MKIIWPLALQAMAFGVAFAEVIVPSFGILLVVCLGLAAYSWFIIITRLPFSAAVWFGAADLVLVPVFIKYAFKYLAGSKISHHSDLGKGDGLEAVDGALQRHVGATAVVDATLRPTGRIRIGDDVFEAQTGGDFIERGASVKILSVSGSRFHVEKQ
jgi:membrane-bound ClpP family serine protease